MKPPLAFAELLARHALLAGAPEAALARLAAAARWVDAGPLQTIIEFDDATTDVYFVLQGSIRVSVQTSDGDRTQILGDYHPGDVVGEMSAIDGAPRSARVETLVRSRLCVVPAAAFLEIATGVPEVGLRLFRLQTARIRILTRRLLEHAALSTRMRLSAELLRLSRPRPDGTLVVSPPPTQEELAARIGTRRETVSRDMSALTRDGDLLRTRAMVVLTNPAAMRARLDALR